MTEEEFYFELEVHKDQCAECQNMQWTFNKPHDCYGTEDIGYCSLIHDGPRGTRRDEHPFLVAAFQYLKPGTRI